MPKISSNLLKIIITCLCLMPLIFFPATALLSEELYKFDRMWPTLEQPWYFYRPTGVAADSNSYVYVANKQSDCIQKFTSDGQFVTKWGKQGSGPGEFLDPFDVAIDTRGFVYVTDMNNCRIQKFNSDGQFVTKWGTRGSAEGEFELPHEIAVDYSGFVYVADTENHRIQKFASDGQFVSEWGVKGDGEGEFLFPLGIAVDRNRLIYVADTDNDRIQIFDPKGRFLDQWGDFQFPHGIEVDHNGFVYVTDKFNHRIQKFSSDGELKMNWGKEGSKDGEFFQPYGMGTDNNKGFLYVADTGNQRIQKFTSDGHFAATWGISSENGKFNTPKALVTDKNGFVYVADTYNHRIQKFVSDGINLRFVTKWGKQGTGNSEFREPRGIATDSKNFVYVTDMFNNRVQKFTSDGVFISKWGNEHGNWGNRPGEFNSPYGIAVDGNDYVYVADKDNHRIQKFTANGEVVGEWGNEGIGTGESFLPFGVATDSKNFVYVADAINCSVRKFTSNGGFVTRWGSEGIRNNEFNMPHGITTETINGEDFVYIADSGNHRIQKFRSDGEFVAAWGKNGNLPSLMSYPGDIGIHPKGNIYIADTDNHRIQVFKRIAALSGNKAIIVAGGGPYDGNNLWDATRTCANFAYRTLNYQGFAKEKIYYLSSDKNVDLDNNGKPDDIDKEAANANLCHAITTWGKDAENLIIYLVDHGGEEVFRMSNNEVLSAADLDSWLDSVQPFIAANVIVIYDACNSGSFLSMLAPQAHNERIVIASTSHDENAHFINQGTISFSNFFWTNIFNGYNIKDAFDLTKQAIGNVTKFQNPVLEISDNISLHEIYIGNGTATYQDAPIIKGVSHEKIFSNKNSRLIYASQVTDNDGIARVWAVISPPNYNQGSSDNPVLKLPCIDLMPVGDGRYEGIYDGFNTKDTYQIAVYAKDRIGNTSLPKITTASVENPLKRKAIIVAGGSLSDHLWPAIKKNANLAYNALISQWYTDDDIWFMSTETFSEGVDGSATLSNLKNTLEGWASQDTRDLVVYIVGSGDEGVFQINDNEILYAYDLDTWLDNLQNNISDKESDKWPDKVTVICDADYSGSFIPLLKPPANKKRIIITSTSGDHPGLFLSQGHISFSGFFWKQVLNGANLRDAFLNAKQAVSFFSRDKTPQLNDNGNGIANEISDGHLSMYSTIGAGIRLADDAPLVGPVSSSDYRLTGGKTSANIMVDTTTTFKGIEKVWSVITPPGYIDAESLLPIFELNSVGNGLYEGTYDDFSGFGTYMVDVYAMDTENNMSLSRKISVFQSDGPDTYEKDDTPDEANFIIVNNETPQHRNFYSGDEDWIKFYGFSETVYTVKISNTGLNCYPVTELYDTDKNPLGSHSTELSRTADQNGIYYVKIRNSYSYSGEGTEYDLSIYQPVGPFPGYIKGTISDAESGKPIEAALVTTDGKGSCITRPNGRYLIIHEPGIFAMTAEFPGYKTVKHSDILVGEGGTSISNFKLEPVLCTIRPDKPRLYLPETGQADVPLRPLLRTEAFYHPEAGCTHLMTHWQISIKPDFSEIVLDITSNNHLTSLAVPDFVLNVNTAYYWRAKFSGSRNKESEWSDTFSFTTVSTGSDDENSNGIPDDQEADVNTDLDNNSIPDNNQDDIKCVNTIIGNSRICVKHSINVVSIESLKSVDHNTIPETKISPREMPFGLITFRAKIDNPDDIAEVIIYFSKNLPEEAVWYKYDLTNGWHDYSLHTVYSNKKGFITVKLKDGGSGDGDGTKNGIITDASGFDTYNSKLSDSLVPLSDDDIEGGSCFIATSTPYNSVNNKSIWFLIKYIQSVY